jgi:putative ABC transport system permease protein
VTLLHRPASILRWIFRRNGAERDLHDEMQSFVDMAAADKMRDGATAAEARRLAVLDLGGIEQTKERVRASRYGAWLDIVGRDMRYGLCQIRRAPAFSAVAIATLALGIGGNAAMFSVVDAVLIRPLPYTDADRLVMVWDDASRSGGEPKFFSTPPEWREWRRDNTVFTDIAATQPGDAALSGTGEPEQLTGRKVTGNFWSVLGATPLLGRAFTEDEDARGARVVVISFGLWERHFGASSDVVGRAITLNDRAYEVIGVMPREFYFMPARDIDIWVPASFPPAMLNNWSWHDVHCVARLKPGVSLHQAGDAMAALSLRLSAQHVPLARSAVVTPLREELAGKTAVSLIVLLLAAGVVLLIACVNLTNLLLARGAVRRREVALRAALGAGRGRLITQFLIESFVLAGSGALAGLALVVPLMRFLETLVPQTMAAVHLTLDWRVLTASTAIAVVAAVTFGLAPAIRSSRLALLDAVRDGARGSTGARNHSFQHTLIIVETALALVLLTIGGLLLQTFEHLSRLDLGIRGDRVLTFVTPLFRYREFNHRVAFVDAELEKIQSIPGVISAGAISRVPLTVSDQATFYRLAGQSDSETNEQVALSRVVTHSYFGAVGARLREGRFFDPSDRRSEAPAAVVNESFADRHFPGRSSIGARIQFGELGPKGYWYTIVGVVKEIRDRGVTEHLQPAVYRVHEQAEQSGDQPSGIVVRTAGDPSSIVSAVRQAIWSIDRNQPIARVQTIDDVVRRQLSVPSQNTVLFSAFALLSLLLASIGLYGVLSYAVTQRTNEIGVRMALGARTHDILIAFSRRGLTLTVAGLTIGLVLAAIAARLMGALFFDFQPDYISAVAWASLVLLAVAALACLVPARRASRINPTTALHRE